MEKKIINRSFLYNLVANSVDKFSRMFVDLIKIKSIFRDSAKFCEIFENKINSENDIDFFRNFFLRNDIEFEDKYFKDYIMSSISSYFSQEDERKKFVSADECISHVFKDIAKYHDKLLKDNFIINENMRSEFAKLPQTFLSYSYSDKGLTLGLFFYFLVNGGFLYVNWMWSGVNPNSSITKSILDNELSNSIQFLFLRTINSEMNLKSNGMIRQWCSWEIGNYYTKKKNKKFMTKFYDLPYKKSDLLQSFNFLNYVYNGVIY